MQLAVRTLLILAMLIAPSPMPAQQVYPTPAGNDDVGFESIFDGKTLDGWEGDSKYWRVENGCLVGEVTPETLLKQNSFNFRIKHLSPELGPVKADQSAIRCTFRSNAPALLLHHWLRLARDHRAPPA